MPFGPITSVVTPEKTRERQHIGELARHRVVFTNAISQTSWTMAFGRVPHDGPLSQPAWPVDRVRSKEKTVAVLDPSIPEAHTPSRPSCVGTRLSDVVRPSSRVVEEQLLDLAYAGLDGVESCYVLACCLPHRLAASSIPRERRNVGLKL